MTTATAGKVRAERLATVAPPALRRAEAADTWLQTAYGEVRSIYRAWVHLVVRRYEDNGMAEVSSFELEMLEGEMLATGTPLTFSMVEAGYEWASQEFGQAAGRSMPARHVKGKQEVPQVVPTWEEFTQTADFSGVEEHIVAVSSHAAKAQAGVIDKLFVRAATATATRAEIAKAVLAAGLVESDTRAALWARTETQWAYNEGAHELYQAEGVAVEEWVTTFDDATCEFCQAMDGIKVRTSENFVEAGDVVKGVDGGEYRTAFPEGHPPLHPNCLIGETPVCAPGVLAGLVAAYSGPVVELTLTDARRLTVSPQHMLLTPAGFVAAASLREGDKVIDCSAAQRVVAGDPENDWQPPTVEQVVAALSESFGMTTASVPVAAEDLHGDAGGVNGHVHIVAPDCLLAGNRQALSAEQAHQFAFGTADAKLALFSGCSNLAAVLFALATATNRIVGGLGIPGIFGAAALGDHEPVSGGAAAPDDSGVVQDAIDTKARTAGLVGQCLDAFAGLVAPVNVVKTETKHVSAHVYDLQTATTLYAANGIVSSNCRCIIVPAFET